MFLFNRSNNINIIIAGILKLFIGLGIGRFAYSSILPYMLEDQSISLNFAAQMASFNYVGYLLGAIFAIFIKSFNKKIFYFRIGLFLTIITTLALALTLNEYILLFSRVLAGFGTAMAIVVGASIIMLKLTHVSKTKAMGIYFTGIGISLALSDLCARYVLSFSSWENAWLFLAIVAFIVSFYPIYILTYEKKNLENKTKSFSFDKTIFSPFVLLIILSYFTQGIGFVVQGTFLPTIIASIDGLKEYAGLTWLLAGIAGIPASIIWTRLAFKYGSVNIIIIVMLIQIIGILIPALTDNLYLNLCSGIIYGATFTGLVALFMNLAGIISPLNPVIVMGTFTTAYGIGQVIAPLYAVYFASLTGNYNYTLFITGFIVFLGVIILLLAKQRYKDANI